MKIKKRVKKLQKQIDKLNSVVLMVCQDIDQLDDEIFNLANHQEKEIVERCAKIADEFFEDDVIQGIQIAKELREILDATPVSKKGN